MCFVSKQKYDLIPWTPTEVTKGVCLQDDRKEERLRVKVQRTKSLGCVVPVLCAGLPGFLSPCYILASPFPFTNPPQI